MNLTQLLDAIGFWATLACAVLAFLLAAAIVAAVLVAPVVCRVVCNGDVGLFDDDMRQSARTGHGDRLEAASAGCLQLSGPINYWELALVGQMRTPLRIPARGLATISKTLEKPQGEPALGSGSFSVLVPIMSSLICNALTGGGR